MATKNNLVELTDNTIKTLEGIAPYVDGDPKKPEDVIRKALKLLDFAKNGTVSVTKPEGTYEVDLKKLQEWQHGKLILNLPNKIQNHLGWLRVKKIPAAV